MIAHRGLSGLETENTCAAFVAAGVKSYFGVETDVHVTKDGKFIIIHDDNTDRVSGEKFTVERTDFSKLRSLTLFDTDRKTKRADLVLPSLEEYISVCKKYEKTCVLELKNSMSEETVAEIVSVVKDMGWSEHTIFISFDGKNLEYVRRSYPQAQVQFLCKDIDDVFLYAKEHRFDFDVWEGSLTEKQVAKAHEAGLKVNAWTVDDPEQAKKLIGMGVDYLTTNILE